MEMIEIKEIAARKDHKCDWCGKLIPKGEKYIRLKFVYDGDLRNWKAHCSCQKIIDSIWDYAYPKYPNEDISGDDFHEYCIEVCGAFICPNCPRWNKEYENCKDDNSYCIDRMDEFFRTHELYRTLDGYYEVWKNRITTCVKTTALVTES